MGFVDWAVEVHKLWKYVRFFSSRYQLYPRDDTALSLGECVGQVTTLFFT